MESQFRLRELLLALLILGVVFALARFALHLQIRAREPTLASIGIQVMAGAVLGLLMGSFFTRMLRADTRGARLLIYSCSFLVAIPGLATVVSLMTLGSE